jgi:hypothetical protein
VLANDVFPVDSCAALSEPIVCNYSLHYACALEDQGTCGYIVGPKQFRFSDDLFCK